MAQKAMAVYCGHQFGINPKYTEAAKKMGELMAQNNIRLVYGAGDVGLMGTVSKANLDAGGYPIGITTPHLLAKQEPAQEGIELEITDTLMKRKARMIELSDAFCILPGGMGTLNEVTDLLVMHQVGETHLPVYFLNTDGFWKVFGLVLKKMIKEGFVKDHIQYNMKIFDTPEELIKAYNARFF